SGFFFSSRRRHTRFSRDWSSDVCSSDLRNNSFRIACESLIHTVSPFYIHQWLSRVLVERLASKSSAVLQILKDTQGDWERTSFIVLARSFGLNVNGDAFEQFARSVPLTLVSKYADR